MVMTNRERFLGTVRFQPVDRVPYTCDTIWESTVRRWINEGLPAEAVPHKHGKISGSVKLESYFGCDSSPGPRLSVKLGILPPFPYELIAEDETTRTERGGLGIVHRTFKQGRETSMPHFVEHPVKDRNDWAQMKKRYDPCTPGRLPEDWGPELIEQLNTAPYPVGVGVNGLFWTCRDWLGVEPFLLMFYDDPWLIHDMMNTLTDLWIETLRPIVQEVQLDSFGLSEDMAYRNASLVSPAMFRQFMEPCYRRLIHFLTQHGVAHICVDCDGVLDQLLPLFLDCGVTAITPVEVQCGNDPIAIRKKYGRQVVIHGGLDKRVLAQDKAAIDQELERKIPPLLDSGGYFPKIDHSIPNNVPFANFCYYMERKRAIIGAAG